MNTGSGVKLLRGERSISELNRWVVSGERVV